MDAASANHMTLLTSCRADSKLAKTLTSLHTVAIKANVELLLLVLHPLFCSSKQTKFPLRASGHTIAFIKNVANSYSAGLSLVHTGKSSQHYSTGKLLHRAEGNDVQVESTLW